MQSIENCYLNSSSYCHFISLMFDGKNINTVVKVLGWDVLSPLKRTYLKLKTLNK
jgi:hypothetical protein